MTVRSTREPTFRATPWRTATFKSDHIVIGNGCSLGVDSWVNYGVTMHDGSTLGADALLMKGEDVPENAIYSGNPAREVMSPVAAPKPLAAVVAGSPRHGGPRHGGPRHREAVAASGGLLRVSKGTYGTHATHATHRAPKASRAQARTEAKPNVEAKAETPGSRS